MSERVAALRLRRSVFAKLMGVMLGMGLLIPLMVGGFFLLFVRPMVNATAESMLTECTDLFAATAPDLELARRAAARHGMQIRYEGPAGEWATAPGLPSITEARRAQGGLIHGAATGYRLVTRSDGGAYLFAWDYRRDLESAHNRMLLVFLGLLVVIVVTAHTLLRRALRPLRWLYEGVAALGEENLEVTVPRKTNDELGALAEAFNRMVGRVREMVRSRDQLLLDVSHELRSPLTRMKVALELGPAGEHRAALAADIRQMEAMVTELLELERLRQGRGLRLATADLVHVVRETAAACADQPPGVRIGATPEQLRLEIDPEKIRRVLSNLLENAAKYALPDSGPITVGVVAAADGAVVTVADDGPGIPPEDLGRVFEPFFRVDRARPRSAQQTGGYGLGLSLCKRIMEAHGGRIAVENLPGRGVRFTLTFPRAR